MLFSLVIPVYNVAEYLQKCMDSVLENDLTDCEILLIDDGSTDGICPKMCDEFETQYPSLVRVIHQENKGLGGARNTGLDAAKGDYILFLDSDDCLTNHCIASLKTIVKEHHPDIVSFSFAKTYGNGACENFAANTVESQMPFTLAQKPEMLLSLPSAWCRLWKRELFLRTEIRFPDRVWYEDIRTTPKLFTAAKSIYSTNDCYYLYLQRQGSIMNSASLERNREIIEAFVDIVTWFQAGGLYDRYAPQLTHLAVEHLFLTASVRVARQDPKHPLLKEFSSFVQENFPQYRDTFPQFSKKHRLLLSLIEGGHYNMVKTLFAVVGKG